MSVLVDGQDVHIQCEKEVPGQRWETLFLPREEDEIAGVMEEEEEKTEVDEETKEQEPIVDLTHLKNSWYV